MKMAKLFLRAITALSVLGCAPAFAQTSGGVDDTARSSAKQYTTNYATNYGFDTSTKGASVSSGGSIAVVSLSARLEGSGSLSWTMAANSKLHLSIKPMANGLKGKNCEASVDITPYIAVSSALVEIYVESNGNIISNRFTYRPDTLNIVARPTVNFPCSSLTGTNDRLTMVASASGGVLVDKFYAGEATNITNQVVVTDWQDFPSNAAGTLITATTTNPTYGTVVTNKAQYRYVGSDVEISWAFRQTTAGSSGSGFYLFNVPSSICVIDTSKVKANTSFSAWPTDYDSYVGTFASGYADTVNGNARGWVSVYSTSQLKVALQVTNTSGSSAVDAWKSGFSAFSQAINFGMNAKLPCVGRSATQSAITQQCIQDGSCENVFSAQVSSGGVVSGENIDFINGNCSGSSPYTCTFNTNFFSAAPNCEITPISSVNTGGTFNAFTTASQVFPRTKNDGSGGNENHAFSLMCQRSSTDYKPRFAAPVLVGSVTSNSTSALRIETGFYTAGSNNFTASTTPGWLGACVRSGTNNLRKTCPLTSGVFSGSPLCFASGVELTLLKTVSSTEIVVDTATTGAPGDFYFQLVCIGPR